MKRDKVYFAAAAYTALEPRKSLGSKYKRLLKKLALEKRVNNLTVGIKMHYGGNVGYSTVPPLFIHLLVKALKEAGAKSVKVMDTNPADGVPRGYTEQVVGCPVISTFGATGRYLYRREINYGSLDFVELGGEAVDCDFFIDLSHVKGHGCCGFGGALKNIAMGISSGPSRAKIHTLEGGILYNEERCTYCLKCREACPHKAIEPVKEKKKVKIIFHNCNFCQHCVMVCPEEALTMEERQFDRFSKGMALVTKAFLDNFEPDRLLFLNFVLNVTIYCDCWGMTTPSLVPDVGVVASENIVAADRASLDLIQKEPLIAKGLPINSSLKEEGGHLFEKIHGKDPYLMLRYLEESLNISGEYKIEEIK